MNSVELIKKLCKERKIPISRLERDLGYGNGYVSQLRKGTIPSDRAVEIANYLNINLQYLLTGGEEHNEDLKECDSRPGTLAAHFEGDEFSDDEMDEIMKYVEFVKSKRK